jgi:hypothetical protein
MRTIVGWTARTNLIVQDSPAFGAHSGALSGGIPSTDRERSTSAVE